MFRHLHTRLAAALFALLVGLGVLYVASTRLVTRLYHDEVQQKLNAELADHVAAEKLLLEDGEVRREPLEEVFHMLMVVNPSIELYLLDDTGEILAYSAPPGRVRRRRVDLGPVRELVSGRASLPVYGDDPRDPQGRKVFSAAPIPPEGPPEGYLYVVLDSERYESAAGMLEGSYILRLATALGAASLLLAVAAGFLLFRRLTRPLRALVDDIGRFRKGSGGDGGAGAGPPPGDEVARLEAAFREMAQRIEGQVARLEEADRLRRELVANVSHDLRTPLAAMQGYLETLVLRKDLLTDAERDELVAVALRHGERMTRLVSELFELATLDARETAPAVEAFSLAELVHDNVQKLQPRARQAGVRLAVDGASAGLSMVSADIGLIERVLENLLENALRFTPQGGVVTVGLRELEGEVEVRVRDTGRGIPPEDIPYIFDRFYRCQPSGADRDGGGSAGLGLAISARILELHGREMAVDSTLGRGTTFSFSLPAPG